MYPFSKKKKKKWDNENKCHLVFIHDTRRISILMKSVWKINSRSATIDVYYSMKFDEFRALPFFHSNPRIYRNIFYKKNTQRSIILYIKKYYGKIIRYGWNVEYLFVVLQPERKGQFFQYMNILTYMYACISRSRQTS